MLDITNAPLFTAANLFPVIEPSQEAQATAMQETTMDDQTTNTAETTIEAPAAKPQKPRKARTTKTAPVEPSQEVPETVQAGADEVGVKVDGITDGDKVVEPSQEERKAAAKAEKARVKAIQDAAKAELKAQAQAAVTKTEKTEAPTIDGFVLKEDANPDYVDAQTKELAPALVDLVAKTKDQIVGFLALGKFMSAVSPLFASTKKFGEYIAKRIPESQVLDTAVRSNAKWLYEALNKPDHEASDILTVLGVNRIENYSTGHPSTIRKHYDAAVKKAQLKEKAKAAGVASEDEAELEKEGKALTKKEQEEARTKEVKAFNKALGAALKVIRAEKNVEIAQAIERGVSDPHKDAMEDLIDLIRECAKLDPKEALEYLQSGGSTITEEE